MSLNKQILAEKFMVSSSKLGRIISQCSCISLEDKLTTLLQLQALTFLEEKKSVTVGELGSELFLSSASVAQLTERLVTAGKIVRKNDPKDRRITRLSLTSEGKKEIGRMKSHVVAKIAILLDYIPENDLLELVRIQTNLAEKLEKKIKHEKK